MGRIKALSPDSWHPIPILIADGDHVATLLPTYGHFSGRGEPAPSPTGGRLDYGMVSLRRLEGEHLVEMWFGMDSLVEMQQMGVAPPATTPVMPRFSGNAVWRGLVELGSVEHLELSVHSHAFLGPGRHFVTYYVSAGRLVNWVGVAPTQNWDLESWTQRGRFEDAVADFVGRYPTVTGLIAAMRDKPIYRWALFDRDPLPEWGRGPVTLVGDACHPMLPFMAQGAAQAIEDAAVLTSCVTTTADPTEAARL